MTVAKTIDELQAEYDAAEQSYYIAHKLKNTALDALKEAKSQSTGLVGTWLQRDGVIILCDRAWPYANGQSAVWGRRLLKNGKLGAATTSFHGGFTVIGRPAHAKGDE